MVNGMNSERVQTQWYEGAIRLLKSNGYAQPIEGYLAFQGNGTRKWDWAFQSARGKAIEAQAPMDRPLGVDRVGDDGV